jgi:hypothetical protein
MLDDALDQAINQQNMVDLMKNLGLLSIYA